MLRIVAGLKSKTRLARQRARAYRLSLANVLLDEKTQQNLRALVQYVSGFVARHRPRL